MRGAIEYGAPHRGRNADAKPFLIDSITPFTNPSFTLYDGDRAFRRATLGSRRRVAISVQYSLFLSFNCRTDLKSVYLQK